jgi:hypothetical protein
VYQVTDVPVKPKTARAPAVRSTSYEPSNALEVVTERHARAPEYVSSSSTIDMRKDLDVEGTAVAVASTMGAAPEGFTMLV